MNAFSIIHEEYITIENNYAQVKSTIQEKLGEWSDLYAFDDISQKIIYKTEGPLIPEDNSKIPVLILLSNPHPHSVKQGMFLSPNRIGRTNPFWDTLRDTGLFNYDGQIDAAVMIKNEYESPFRFFIAVLLPFPTEDPSDLRKLFEYNEYKKMYFEGRETIYSLIVKHEIKNIVCFGSIQYDALTQNGSPEKYTSILSRGDIIRDKCNFIPSSYVFLTYPTGWRFMKNYKAVKSSI